MSLERFQRVRERRLQIVRRAAQVERALRLGEEPLDEEHAARSDAPVRVGEDGGDLEEERAAARARRPG